MPIDHVICSLLESTTMEFSLLYSEFVQIGVGSNKKVANIDEWGAGGGGERKKKKGRRGREERRRNTARKERGRVNRSYKL